jgi:hypothetical protein
MTPREQELSASVAQLCAELSQAQARVARADEIITRCNQQFIVSGNRTLAAEQCAEWVRDFAHLELQAPTSRLQHVRD